MAKKKVKKVIRGKRGSKIIGGKRKAILRKKGSNWPF